MSKIPLNESRTATFDASGIARIVVGPTVYGSVWELKRALVSATARNRTSCTVYHGVEADSSILDVSNNGNNDDTALTIELHAGDTLRFVWKSTPDDVGRIASLSLIGTLDTGRL